VSDRTDEPGEVPEGAAVFPQIPDGLGVDPLLLAVVHATVFLAGSDESIVDAEAADEALERLAEYLQRLDGERLRRVKEDLACLVAYAKQQRWPRGEIQTLRTFLQDMGAEGDPAGPEGPA
jgi:hypothetical protein